MRRSQRHVGGPRRSSRSTIDLAGNAVFRNRCRLDRVLEQIVAVFDSRHCGIVGARVVTDGTEVAVYVMIPDAVVRFRARQRRAAAYDRMTSVLNLIDALAVDDLDRLEPLPGEFVCRELAEMALPPFTGWRTQLEWPSELIDAAIADTWRLVGDVVGDVEALADGCDDPRREEAIGVLVDEVLHVALQKPAADFGVEDGRLVVPARLVFSAGLLDLPARGWRSTDLGCWQVLTVAGIELCVATTEPTWIVERAG